MCLLLFASHTTRVKSLVEAGDPEAIDCNPARRMRSGRSTTAWG
jgi:hypothetical protein